MLNLSRTIRGLELLAFLLCGYRSYAAVPDWVRQAAAEKLPAYEAETNAVVLLDETTITVTGPDEYVEHARRVVKILRPEGRGEASFGVYFRGKEKILSMHAWSLDATGHDYEVKDKEFAERGVSFGYDLYNDIRMRTTTTPGADPGSIHAFEYEVRRHPWLNQLYQEFQKSIPVHEARFGLQLPAGWEYKTSWAGTAPVAPVETAGNGAVWTLRDLPAIEREPMRPALGALATWLGVAYYGPELSDKAVGSWEAMGRWMNQLTAERRTPTPELSERVRQLTAGTTDFDGKVRALASFLQTDIRYVAIEIGIGGYQPHPAGDIFHLRYGDCKDKATLLSSMLHEVGIESDYVIISTHRGMAHPDLPALVFNHAILAIELPPGLDASLYRSVVAGKNGKPYLIFDPTDTYTPLGNLRGDLQDTYALLVTNAGGELIHTPLLVPDANLLTRTGHFRLGAEGALSGEIVENRSGDHAFYERAALMHANQQQRSEHLEQRLNRSMKGFTVQSMDIQGIDQLQQKLVTTFKFTTPGYSQVRGPLLLVRPRVIGEKGFPLERKPRKYPFQFESTSRETDTYEIELPQGYVVDDLPDPVKVDSGFASYESKVEIAGSKLKYSREYVRKNVLIPPERTEELRKFLAIIGADEASVVVLKRAL
jgi:hypothetical protein